jgi:hypothetical protein
MQQALFSLVTSNIDTAAVIEAMDLMIVILQNIIENPTEQRFRKLKLTNKRLARTVTSQAGAVPFLKAVGFEHVEAGMGSGELLLKRDDPGLLWMGRSLLEQQRAGQTA